MAFIPASRLSAHEWELILQALSVYQHHSDFRELYEKLGGEAQKAA